MNSKPQLLLPYCPNGFFFGLSGLCGLVVCRCDNTYAPPPVYLDLYSYHPSPYSTPTYLLGPFNITEYPDTSNLVGMMVALG